MKYQVTIEETGVSYACDENESILKGMAKLGQKGIPVGCCGGGCGICKIGITEGEFVSKVMSRQHVSPEEQSEGIVLACRVMPRSDISLRVLGKMKKNVDKCARPVLPVAGQLTALQETDMPVVNFHLIEGTYTEDQAARLLTSAAEYYADLLQAPVDRIRCFITRHAPRQMFAGGRIVSGADGHAPFFECYVLEGRTVAQRHSLISGFTDLLEQELGVERSLIRGCCHRIDPDDWGIAGTPASVARKAEIEVRRHGD